MSRAKARELVLAQDAWRRQVMPFFRARPRPSEQEIEAALPWASARHAFWQDLETKRPIEVALASATQGQIAAYCVPYSHSDICNGGFHQYFSNLGELAMPTLDALLALGENERAKILKAAMARFPGGIVPTSPPECRRVLDAIDFHGDWRPWIAPIEEAYYALGDESLERALSEFVSAHPEELFVED